MAEYIDRERVIQEIKGMDNCGCITRSVNHVCENMRGIPTADVIERSEYELIHRQLAQAFDRIAELDKLNGELHSKIDKAIEEITNLNRYQEGIDTMNVGDDLMISWCKTLDILKEI